MHTISFTILDEMSPIYGPVHMNIENLQEKSIKIGVMRLSQPFLKYKKRERKEKDYKFFECWPKKGESVDTSGYYTDYTDYSDYSDYSDECMFSPYYVVKGLSKHGYYRMNSVNKYYSVAFAIDYTRFNVWSKDCDETLIKWFYCSEDCREFPKSCIKCDILYKIPVSISNIFSC